MDGERGGFMNGLTFFLFHSRCFEVELYGSMD